ncbi:hypothetical protein JW897_08085 [Chromobacterium alkanivorans]|uniref:hypothetical protein n=1 Tax=Chromobacterium alkanivorans TaxID=1071719 RepID=UPI001968744A|nr:hypothetical protein [Chromobacterium alkanivorans]MBN3003694.1 hypothetical protein [Chromobacterium alkanivorans]
MAVAKEGRRELCQRTLVSLYGGLLLFMLLKGVISLWMWASYQEPAEADLHFTAGKVTAYPLNRNPGLRVDLVFDLNCSLNGYARCSACSVRGKCDAVGRVIPEEAFGSKVEVWWYKNNERATSGRIYALRLNDESVFGYQDAVRRYREERGELLSDGVKNLAGLIGIVLLQSGYLFWRRRTASQAG